MLRLRAWLSVSFGYRRVCTDFVETSDLLFLQLLFVCFVLPKQSKFVLWLKPAVTNNCTMITMMGWGVGGLDDLTK